MSKIIVQNDLGNIVVSDEVIAQLSGISAVESYGIVGMCSRSKLKDSIVELLGKDNISRGVEVHSEGDGVNIDLFVIVAYGIRVSEVAHNIMHKVKYIVESIVGIEVNSVNINVEGVRDK